MLIIAGIIPMVHLPLVTGKVGRDDQSILVSGHSIPCVQGTAAMVSAALAAAEYLGAEAPQVVLAGDTGSGDGSRKVYQYLIENIENLQPQVLALHYWMPDLELIRILYKTIERCAKRPVLIADAASMYAAKATGLAPGFDIFTPDSSEIAFLADSEAIHPAYIEKHLFELDSDINPDLIKMAYQNNGASRILLVKGETDIIADRDGIIAKIDGPDVPAMECIGGTGDSITGMCAALVYRGIPIEQAAVISAKVNRIAGQIADVNPASGISTVIKQIPLALSQENCN